jgi:hypothetical protein
MEVILSTGKQALMITIFVLSMMLIIEYLNVLSKGLWSKNLKTSTWKQIVLAAVLGIIPGCLGAYTAVSLYVHNIFGIGAIVATMIATSGDEAFMMFSVIPDTALVLHVSIFIIAIVSGLSAHLMFKNKHSKFLDTKHFHVHDTPECVCFDKRTIVHQLTHIKPVRVFLLLFIIFMIVMITGGFQHNDVSIDKILNVSHSSHHSHPAWIRITFLVVLLFSFFTVLTVNDHFLEKHLWGHLMRKHFFRIFLWSFGTLLVFHYLDEYLDLERIISDNIWLVLIIAVLVGVIPESGPHFIFVILFAGGTLPFSILLANSIVQDGHGSLPLIAESPKDFIFVKVINVVAGLIVGAAGLIIGF